MDHNNEERYVNASRCDCGDIRTDIEGMKLDIVINETGLRREINRNAQTISELQKLNSTCPSSADLEDIKHAIATLQLKLEGLQMPGNDDISNVGETFSDGEQPISKNSNNEKDGHISPDLEFYKNNAKYFEQKYYELRATFGTKIFELEQSTNINANLVDQAIFDNNLNQDKQHEHNAHCPDASTETIDDHNFNNSVIIMNDSPSSESNDTSIMVINQPYEELTADASSIDRLSYNQRNSVQRNSVSRQTLTNPGQPIPTHITRRTQSKKS